MADLMPFYLQRKFEVYWYFIRPFTEFIKFSIMRVHFLLYARYAVPSKEMKFDLLHTPRSVHSKLALVNLVSHSSERVTLFNKVMQPLEPASRTGCIRRELSAIGSKSAAELTALLTFSPSTFHFLCSHARSFLLVRPRVARWKDATLPGEKRPMSKNASGGKWEEVVPLRTAQSRRRTWPTNK